METLILNMCHLTMDFHYKHNKKIMLRVRNSHISQLNKNTALLIMIITTRQPCILSSIIQLGQRCRPGNFYNVRSVCIMHEAKLMTGVWSVMLIDHLKP